MGDVVNLRMARKRKARAAREADAEENRIRHGRTRAERDRLNAESTTENRRLDGHRRDRTDKKPS